MGKINTTGRKKTLPPDRVGHQPVSTKISRSTRGLLLAALRLWEIKQNGGVEYRSTTWDRRSEQ